MLIIGNNGNWEKSERTSTVEPEYHVEAGTVFLPVNVSVVKVPTVMEDGDVVDLDGFAYDEYRINHPVDLPQDAVDALFSAMISSVQALAVLGVR